MRTFTGEEGGRSSLKRQMTLRLFPFVGPYRQYNFVYSFALREVPVRSRLRSKEQCLEKPS